MMSFSKVIASAVLLVGTAAASDPASVQDPPGHVGVDQPAGVSLADRNTDRDTTDTLHGGRTEVIEGARTRVAGSDVRVSEGRGNVQPGTEARASFESGNRAATATGTGRRGDAAEGTSESTSLGTDTGHGTGTEPVAPTRAR